MVEETNKHFGLALTSLILGGVSLLSFMLYGLSAIPALMKRSGNAFLQPFTLQVLIRSAVST